MGIFTKGVETDTTTFTERKDVEEFVHEFAEEQGWDLSDVRNRAIMYYARKYKKGELDDNMVDMGKRNKAELRDR